MINKGYLTAKTNKESDEFYTPEYAVMPLLKYLKNYKENLSFHQELTIWCPFDEEDSNYVKIFKENGYKVIHSHINEGKNFFMYEPKETYDIIISNPPFSLKDEVLKRLAELNKPFVILFPLPALQGIKRFKIFKYFYKILDMRLQLIIFDKRINFYKNKTTKEILKNSPFASIYLCANFFENKGNDIIFEELDI